MLVVLSEGADPRTVERALAGAGLWCRRLQTRGAKGPAQLWVLPHSQEVSLEILLAIDGVAAIADSPSPHPRLDAQVRPAVVAGVRFGVAEPPVLLAGPCAVESAEQVGELARRLARQGVRFLRGGAFKPRSSPYAFRGHGEVALGWLRRAADESGLGVVTEALGEGDVAAVAEHADLVQVGSRNMQNFALLRECGRRGKPVLLKRGMAATLEEWRLAAEHCLEAGAPSVLLCERGIRGFDGETRNLLDLGAVALLAHVHGLPVIVDPSHASGRRDLVVPLARAALAAGAAGLLIETHADPGAALSDGPQALLPEELARIGAPPAREASEPRGVQS